ncbi:MAG: GNAT family N-acetyltransferase [Methylobacteriaceae bacterium]|nr:GNAT family N-acetyltransferase [Methylobacteriaceae bacterium]
MIAVRPAEDRDAQDLLGLVALCFAEYPGCFVDPHDDVPDLVRPGTATATRGGRFWVVEDESGRVCASAALDWPEPGACEIHRVYVRPDRRRRGLARELVALAEQEGRAEGAARALLWSDTRFEDAHRLYEALGYARTGATRELGDVSGSREFGFVKDI